MSPKRLIQGCLAVISALSLGACITNEQVDGPFYPQGFQDGCRTAEARQASFSTKVYRDTALFDKEPSYRSGWRAGFQQCDRMSNVSSRPGDLGERDPR